MPFSSSHYAADAYVTGANPAPGQALEFEYQIRSGTGYATGTSVRYDGGIGLNTYVAGGTGPSGTVDVSGRVALQDIVGNTVLVYHDGVYSVAVQDELVQNILKSILVELRIMNTQLAMMTGEEIDGAEIDE